MSVSVRIAGLAVLLLTKPAFAQDAAPLKLIPEDVSAVIRLQAIDTTTRDLANFVNRVQPGIGALVYAQATPVLGKVLQNPTLAGIDRSRELYIALSANRAVKKVHAALVLPVTDVQAVKDAMGPTYTFVEVDDWLVCADNADLLERVKQTQSGTQSSVAGLLDDRSREILTTGHLGVVVNAVSLRDEFSLELGSADEKLEKALTAMGEQIRRQNPQMDLTMILNMYRELGQVGLQAVHDSKLLTIGVQATEESLKIEELLLTEAGSQTGNFLSSQPLSDLAELTSVPQGAGGYVGFHADLSALLGWWESQAVNMFEDPAVKEHVQKSMAILRECEFGTMAIAMDLVPEQEAAFQYFGVLDIQPVSAMREAMKGLGPGLEYEVAGIKQKQSFEPAAETIDGREVDIFRMEQEMPPGLDPLGIQNKINARFYGPEGMLQRMVVDDDRLLQTMGGGQEAMKKLLNTQPWSDPVLTEARQRLHDKANLAVLVDIPNMAQRFFQLLLSTNAVPLPISEDQLAELEVPSSYAGFSVAAGENQVHAVTHLPIETFQGFVKIGMFVQQLAAGPR